MTIADHFTASLKRAPCRSEPYAHWVVEDVLPRTTLEDLLTLPLQAPGLEGPSGARELHNDTRTYIEPKTRVRFPVCDALAASFDSPQMRTHIENICGCDLTGGLLRIEIAQDTKGFWLKPHTDIGVKLFTMLLYLGCEGVSEAEAQELGTDIYVDATTHHSTVPFVANTALIFVPSDDTWHGFEPRTIGGVRKSLIINYVTDAWRERWQLA